MSIWRWLGREKLFVPWDVNLSRCSVSVLQVPLVSGRCIWACRGWAVPDVTFTGHRHLGRWATSSKFATDRVSEPTLCDFRTHFRSCSMCKEYIYMKAPRGLGLWWGILYAVYVNNDAKLSCRVVSCRVCSGSKDMARIVVRDVGQKFNI
jgi:hypothetical protein